MPAPSTPFRPWIVALALPWLLAAGSGARAIEAPDPADPAASMDTAIADAEASLRDGELQAAESRYRSALLEGWLLLGSLDAADGRLEEALAQFRRAGAAAVET